MAAKKTWWYLRRSEQHNDTILTCYEDRYFSARDGGYRLVASFDTQTREAAQIICGMIEGWIPDAEALIEELQEYYAEMKKQTTPGETR